MNFHAEKARNPTSGRVLSAYSFNHLPPEEGEAMTNKEAAQLLSAKLYNLEYFVKRITIESPDEIEALVKAVQALYREAEREA
jgi:hypothetical protein